MRTLIRLIAFKLASQGWSIRSGYALGADQEAYWGFIDYTATQSNAPVIFENYLPNAAFNRPHIFNNNAAFIDYQKLPLDIQLEAKKLAGISHNAWHNCKDYIKDLHSRNMLEILGKQLNDPSQGVVFWAEEINGKIDGGTATAVTLAKAYKIPVTNLYLKKDFERALTFLDISEETLFNLAGIRKENREYEKTISLEKQ